MPREPLHVHVRQGGALAKFWLEPEVMLAESHGIPARDLRELTRVVRAHKDAFAQAWKDHFHE